MNSWQWNRSETYLQELCLIFLRIKKAINGLCNFRERERDHRPSSNRNQTLNRTVERSTDAFAVVRRQFAFAQVFHAFRDHNSLRHPAFLCCWHFECCRSVIWRKVCEERETKLAREPEDTKLMAWKFRTPVKGVYWEREKQKNGTELKST